MIGPPALAALLVALQGAAPAGSPAAEVLDDGRYRFCHDDDYRLDEWEHQWCTLVGERNEACPGLPGACKRPPRPAGRVSFSEDGTCDKPGEGEGASGTPAGRSGPGEGRRGDRAGDTGDGKRPPPPSEPPPRRTVQIPNAMSGLAQVVFFLLIAAGLGLLVWVIVRSRLTGRDDPDGEELIADEPAGEPTRQDARVVETDVARLLRRAREAAGRGDYEQAIADAYAAALRKLEGEGLLDLHSSHTNADHLRALGDRPELAGELRTIVGDVERVQFGATAASASLFESLLARVLPLTARPALVFILALVATLLGSSRASAADLAGSFTSPSGAGAVVELLRRNEVDASFRLDELGSISEDVDVLVLLSEAGLEDGNWAPLIEWVSDGGTLVLAGVLPDDERLAIRHVFDSSTTTTLNGAWRFESLLAGLNVQVPPGAALRVDAGGLEALPMLVREEGSEPLYALQGDLGQGEIIALADDHLFTNIALAVGDNGEAVVRILKGRGTVELATSWTGAAASSPFEAVHRARLTPLIAQLLVLLTLLFLWKGIAFGKLRDPRDTTRRRFADHVRAVGLQYTRARASAHALSAYSRWALERLRERVPQGRQSDLDELADKLAVRTGWAVDEISNLLRYAQAASDTGPAASLRPSSLRAGLAPAAQALSLTEADQRHLPLHVEQMQRLAALIAALGRRRESP
ncbi:MAG: DUF4129 domain-containing protein [Deltaproteobacteria bacterium]|nr:DUF4129 domain-containing protein [Deltaproteobacteria bacterium]